MVKPPGVFSERFVRAVGEGEQAGAPKWWSYYWGGPLTRRQTSWHFEGLKIGPQK